MFTIQQIKEAHSKVKSGVDFPKYVQEMKVLGVQSYEHFVSDGHIHYNGANNFTLSADAKWSPRKIAVPANSTILKEALATHQQGKTDYPTFCKQAAEAGVDKWKVDLENMICVYYDKAENELLAEKIP